MQARRQQLCERPRAMTNHVFLSRIQLPERCGARIGNEHRVIAEALVATRRPGGHAVDAADERLGVIVWPRHAQRRDEPGAAICRAAQLAVHPRHCRDEILARTSPPRRINPRRTIQRGNAKARIVGERRQAPRPCRGQCLDPRIPHEVGRGLLGFGQSQRTRGDHRNIVRLQQIGEFSELAGIVAGQDQLRPRLQLPCHQPPPQPRAAHRTTPPRPDGQSQACRGIVPR